MAQTFAQQMEEIIKANGDRGLETLLYYQGLELELYRQTVRDDAYARVHNKNAGNPVELIATFEGAIAGDDFFPTSVQQAGVFKSAWLYCASTVDIKAGDEVRVVRTDGRRMAYRVELSPAIGQTTQVFTKWQLSGIM